MNPFSKLLYKGIGFSFSLILSFTAQAGNVVLNPGGLGQLAIPVKSFQELRFQDVVKQAYDFSCGSAALATLLTHYYEQPMAEKDVFVAMYEAGDQEKIRRKGFSLLDMKSFLESRGLRADGFRISLDKLVAVNTAAIALINTGGYSHFVVIKAVDDDRVLLGDPALGNRSVSRLGFEEMWNGIFFVIHGGMETDRNHFNQPDAWANLPRPPLGEAISRDTLAQFTMSLSPRLVAY